MILFQEYVGCRDDRECCASDSRPDSAGERETRNSYKGTKVVGPAVAMDPEYDGKEDGRKG
jgi:hypothetical protein